MCLIHSFNNIYFHLQCNKQFENYEYDYYVMQWTTTILQAGIDRDWDQMIPQYKITLKFGV